MNKKTQAEFVKYKRAKLTPRHIKILKGLRKGKTQVQIAKELDLVPVTVNAIVNQVREQTKTTTVVQLIADLVAAEIL